MFVIVLLLLIIAASFGAGYCAREVVSRRRRARHLTSAPTVRYSRRMNDRYGRPNSPLDSDGTENEAEARAGDSQLELLSFTPADASPKQDASTQFAMAETSASTDESTKSQNR